MAAEDLSQGARPELNTTALSEHYSELGFWLVEGQLPIVYSEVYNIRFFGLEKLHPFDSTKFSKVVARLIRAKVLQRKQLVEAGAASYDMLADVHTPAYLHEMTSSSSKMAQVVELPPVAWFPNFLMQRILGRPQLFHVGGTMKAMGLALIQGWAINLGGGMHHAHRQDGAGWCAFDDIMLGIRKLRAATNGRINKFLYVDLDVHQGNGVERDKLHFEDDAIFVLDMFNADLWPGDTVARRAMNINSPFRCGIRGPAYLQQLEQALAQASGSFKPDYIVYNAGTDVLTGDPLGRCHVAFEDIIARDQRVFQHAAEADVPICMLLSGGYASQSAAVIAASIINLFSVFKLGAQQRQGADQAG